MKLNRAKVIADLESQLAAKNAVIATWEAKAKAEAPDFAKLYKELRKELICNAKEFIKRLEAWEITNDSASHAVPVQPEALTYKKITAPNGYARNREPNEVYSARHEVQKIERTLKTLKYCDDTHIVLKGRYAQEDLMRLLS